jgi:uncharacterized protein YbaR (Trm112 family)
MKRQTVILCKDCTEHYGIDAVYHATNFFTEGLCIESQKRTVPLADGNAVMLASDLFRNKKAHGGE